MKRRPNALRKETTWTGPAVWALVIVALTGYMTYLDPTHGVWQQWTYLLHVVTGLYLTVVLAPYLLWHVRRTVGVRRPLAATTGWLGTLVLLGLVVTGLDLSAAGQREAQRWIMQVHLWTSMVTLGLLAGHVLGHRLTLPARRRDTPDGRFPALSQVRLVSGVVGTALLGIGIAAATFLYSALPSPYTTEPAVTPYALTYGPHPFRPSQTETASGTFVDIKQIAGSEDCAACHTDIALQWRASIHSQAASDPAYATNIDGLAKKRGLAATRYCEGCHSPVALLTGQLTPLGFHSATPGTPAHREGISCMACHGISQVVHVKGVGSYRFAPTSEYLFAGSEHPLARRLHNYLIRIQPREHRRSLGRALLKSPELCATCHVQFMDSETNNWGWVKMQDEYSAWLDSHYSGRSDQAFAHRTMTRCQDCHMPSVTASDPSADTDGRVRSHHWVGANTAIPWLTGDEAQLRRTVEFLQSAKMRVSIDLPSRNDASRGALISRAQITPDAESPRFAYIGEHVGFRVVVTNAGVGHDFPGGTVDINEAWLAVDIRDADNKTVFESGAMQADGKVDPRAIFYRAAPVDRQGQAIWRHELFEMVGETYRRTIPAGGADVVEHEFQVPGWAKPPLTISAVLRYRKFNDRYAAFAIDTNTHRLPVVDMARDSVTLALRYKPPVSGLTSEQDRAAAPAKTD